MRHKMQFHHKSWQDLQPNILALEDTVHCSVYIVCTRIRIYIPSPTCYSLPRIHRLDRVRIFSDLLCTIALFNRGFQREPPRLPESPWVVPCKLLEGGKLQFGRKWHSAIAFLDRQCAINEPCQKSPSLQMMTKLILILCLKRNPPRSVKCEMTTEIITIDLRR